MGEQGKLVGKTDGVYDAGESIQVGVFYGFCIGLPHMKKPCSPGIFTDGLPVFWATTMSNIDDRGGCALLHALLISKPDVVGQLLYHRVGLVFNQVYMLG